MLPHSEDTSAAGSDELVRPFMPELDTLRGIAVLGVIFLHGFYSQYSALSMGLWPGRFIALTQPGWIGVNLFFVLSGFLITGILLDSRDKPNFYRRFYTRRALRILPAYYSLLILLLLLRTSSAAFVGLSFIYLANVTNLFGVACDYGPLWSLAVEEHFYILWPTVVRKTTPRRLALVSTAIMVLIPIFRAVAFERGQFADWYTWFVVDGLAAGSLLAVYLRSGASRHQVSKACWILLSLTILASVAGYPFGITTRNSMLGAGLQYTILNVFFAGILLLFLLIGTSSKRKYLDSPVLRFLGYISYGLYLDHLLAFRIYDRLGRRYLPGLMPSAGHFDLVLLRFTLAAGGAVGVAYLSRRYFEERFLRLKDRLVPEAAATVRGVAGVSSPPEGTEAA